MEARSFRDMVVWQEGMNLVEAIYRQTAGLPSSEAYGLTSQMRRSAVSIPSSIAEGYTRESTREYLYQISVAQASLAELQTQIEICGRLGYFAETEQAYLLNAAIRLSKRLYTLRNTLHRKLNSQNAA